MPYGASIPVLGDFLRLTYIENPGMAFGIDVGGKLFFSLFSIVASVAIFVYLLRGGDVSFGFRISLAMILGGAVGNLIDRVFYGVLYGEAPLFHGKGRRLLRRGFLQHHPLRLPPHPLAGLQHRRRVRDRGVILLLLFHRAIDRRPTVHRSSLSPGTRPRRHRRTPPRARLQADNASPRSFHAQ